MGHGRALRTTIKGTEDMGSSENYNYKPQKISHFQEGKKKGPLKMEEYPKAIDLDSNQSLKLDDDDDDVFISRRSEVIERLKRIVKLIVSICMFCMFLSLFYLFPHSFSVYFSTFLFSLLNHAMERKYMFLICNGILFLLATTSSVIQHSSSFPIDHQFEHEHHHHLVAAIDNGSDSKDQSEQQNQEEEEEEEEMEEGSNRGDQLLEEEFEEDEDEGCFTDDDDNDDDEEGRRRELEVVVNTEELNKKFEEFIRKMKEEMRIEAAAAQTQLIAV